MAVYSQAEIISIGTELLMGEIADSNARYLASELRLIGIEVGRVTTTGDHKAGLINVFRETLSRTDLILSSGGLGPTDDDNTRDCLAEVLGEILYVDTVLEQQLREYFARFGRRHMPATNIRQAMLIPSARSIPNPNGTAPGWWAEKDGKIIILIPGPPREMEPMWRNEIRPGLLARFPDKVSLTRTLKIFGMYEATVNEMVAPFFHMDNPTLGIYAKADGIHLRLISRGDNAAGLIEDTERRIRNILKDHIWGVDEQTLPNSIAALLFQKGLSLATFDAGTGGSISNQINETEDSYRYYRGSLVAGSDGLKIIWEPSTKIYEKYGAISAETAEAMAATVKDRFSADIGLSVTGITGIEGFAGETAGIAYIGLADINGMTSWRQAIIPRRNLARNQLANAALFRLWERLKT
jgi:nicotinamide-nucleotide amidase